jgi:hypothetical protein
MRFDDCMRLPDLSGRQPHIDGQVYLGCKPELCLTIRMSDMHVNSCLLAREEEQAELAVAE